MKGVCKEDGRIRFIISALTESKIKHPLYNILCKTIELMQEALNF